MWNSDKHSGKPEQGSDNSRNNNGTIGEVGGVEHEPKGSFKEMTERAKENKPVNERGIRENEENHAVGNIEYGHGDYAPGETDPNEVQKPDPNKTV